MKVLIAGDFCPQERVANAFDHNDYQSVLSEVRPLIEVSDFSIVNFECPITKGSEKPIPKLGPNLHCSGKGLEAIKWAGFNCVTLANNHFYDFGEEGVKNTLEMCRSFRIDKVGGGLNLKEASQILYKQIEGKMLAIINCCEHEFSIATKTTAGSNPLNPIQQYYAIQEAKLNADYVLVIVHGGHEHYQLPSPRMQETYRFFIDAGADAVVNHHQHCFSGYEVYQGKPIFYGLGNFCFDHPVKRDGIWTEGYAVCVDFTSDLPSFSIIPYRQCGEVPKVEMLPGNAYKERIEILNATIADTSALQSEVDAYYSSCSDKYSNILEPVRNRFYLGAKHRGWLPSFISKKRKLIAADFIICEAHRDKLMYYLNKY